MSLESRITRWFSDAEPSRWGSGWISGTVSVFLGALSVLTVLCLRYPGMLVMADIRGAYPVWLVRWSLEVAIGLSFGLGLLSAVLRHRKVLAATGIGLAWLAMGLGGPDVPIGEAAATHFYLGLDWFVLELLLLTLIFVPLERWLPQRQEQSVFRPGWVTDLQHFFVSHVFVQLLTFLTLWPATVFFADLTGPDLRARVQAQPLWLQAMEVMVVADVSEYLAHRLFHAVPWLWRFHAVHHSVEHMDWIAGSRLHPVDIVVIRAITFLPIYLLGFATSAVYAYLLLVSFHAVFVHANLRYRTGAYEQWFGMPRFHHWHHSSEPEAIDKNFALLFPWIDRLFGTLYLPPKRWPQRYGGVGYRLPEGWWPQFKWPFQRRRKTSSRESA
jgi:lathosterol oxidase